MSENTLLLVDDEPQVREVLSSILERNGYKVLQAGNYYEAMKAASDSRVDFLIADVSLPGPNGCELAARLVDSQPSLQVLFISGYTGAEICRSYGILHSDAHFLGKPFTPELLVERVAELLKESDEHRSAFTQVMIRP